MTILSSPEHGATDQRPGAGIPVCKHAGCVVAISKRSKHGYCGLHKGDANIKRPSLSGEELHMRRQDDRWELNHGETDSVACRICGVRMACLAKGRRGHLGGHLRREHGMTVSEYHKYCQSKGWGSPPVISLLNAKAIAEWHREHPATREENTQRIKNRRRRRKADPEFARHEQELARRRKQRNLSDADKQVRVQCPVPNPISGLPCGEWHRLLPKHLDSAHGLSVAAFNLLCPGAPIAAPDLLGKAAKVGEFSRKLWAERKRKLAEADGQPGMVRLEYTDALPAFKGLFSSPKVKADPRLLLTNCKFPESFTDKHIIATRIAAGRFPRVSIEELADVATREYVALATQKSRDTIDKYLRG